MICVSISHMAQISDVLRSGARMIELRLDLIRDDPREIYAKLDGDVRTIATCRPGGVTEEERVNLLKTSMELGASFIDIEIESPEGTMKALRDHAHQCQTELIVSYHNFEVTPVREALVDIFKSCVNRGGSVVKIATRVNSLEDTLNLISLYDLPGKKVVIGMGSMGRITRVLAPYLGAEFTFASTGGGDETAPGQFTSEQLKEIFKAIDEP